MSETLVERLRTAEDDPYSFVGNRMVDLWREAADRIEALEAERDQLQAEKDILTAQLARWVDLYGELVDARAALGGKDGD